MRMFIQKMFQEFINSAKLFFTLFLEGLILVLIYFLLIEFGIFLNDNFGEDYVFLPIILGSLILVYCLLYHSTKNSIKGRKKTLEIIKILNQNIKNGIVALVKGLFKTGLWLLVAIILIAMIWLFGSFIVSLSATTIIIILLLLILFK